jgi:hypothetical protein
MQEIALAGLYRGGFFEEAAFYGGTALRVFYQLDRFSEDMDFSLLKPNDNFSLTPYFTATFFLLCQMLSNLLLFGGQAHPTYYLLFVDKYNRALTRSSCNSFNNLQPHAVLSTGFLCGVITISEGAILLN